MHFEDLEVNEWPDTDANPSELPALFGEKIWQVPENFDSVFALASHFSET